jgi:hypothetical protein
MAEYQSNNIAGLVIANDIYEDATFSAGAAETWLAGTLLGRITANGFLRAYVSGAVDGSEIPVAVLKQEIVWAGIGTAPGRALVSGEVRREQLVEFGVVGTIPVALSDALRDYGILSRLTHELAESDNS